MRKIDWKKCFLSKILDTRLVLLGLMVNFISLGFREFDNHYIDSNLKLLSFSSLNIL